jgi:hypothetical protein
VTTARKPTDLESLPHWFTEMSLADSLQVGECLVCSNLLHSERRAIHSFLWEGMMSPDVRGQFLEGGGFCSRHFWIAKGIEEECWRAGGIGIAILCENLVACAISDLSRETFLGRADGLNPFHRRKAVHMPLPGSGCMFCRDSIEREESLIATLEYLKYKPTWATKLEQSPLCAHHVQLALAIWKGSEDKQELRGAFETRLRELQLDLNEYIRKSDWNHRDEPLGRERDALERAIRVLTGSERQFLPYKTASGEGGSNGGRKR